MFVKKYKKWAKHIRLYRLPILEEVFKFVSFNGSGLELGAGTSWFSAIISRLPNVTNILAIDNNKNIQKLAKQYFLEEFGGDNNKISFLLHDFHSLPIPSSSIDFIIIDACLHHSDNLSTLLSEAHRVLKPHGTLIAIREPVLPKYALWKKYTFGLEKRLCGGVEKIYTKEQWISFFENNYFLLNIYEYYLKTTPKERLISAFFKKYNGLLFNRYFFIAKPLKNRR